jgi:hypothetical protein
VEIQVVVPARAVKKLQEVVPAIAEILRLMRLLIVQRQDRKKKKELESAGKPDRQLITYKRYRLVFRQCLFLEVPWH